LGRRHWNARIVAALEESLAAELELRRVIVCLMFWFRIF
jgi:hypothetical protein